jgi:hypothetical protein
MSLDVVFKDGFDHLAASDLTQKWLNTSSVVGASKVTGVYGYGSAQRYLNANRTITTPTLTARATYVVTMHFRFDALPASDVILLNFREGTTSHTDLRVTAAGAIRATRNGTSLGLSATGLVTTNTWYYLEALATVNDTTGVVTVSLNLGNILSLTGQDTRNAGSTGLIDNVQLNSVSGSNSDWDNFHVINASSLPGVELVIDTVLPSGAGNSTHFTPSAGSNHQNVDDATSDGDTTYNSSTTATNKDTFAMTNFRSGVVEHIQVCVAARKDDGGTRQLAIVTRSDGADYDGATQTVTSSYAVYRESLQLDPDTAADWGQAAASAAEFGYKQVA